MENRCVCCGEIIPEGRQVCPLCEEESHRQKKKIKKAGEHMPWWVVLLIILFCVWVVKTR